MVNKTIFTAFIMIISLHAYGQKEFDPEAAPTFFERVYVGGNVSFEFGDFTVVDLSPLAGYMVTNMFSVGLGATYRYFSVRDFNFETSIYGGRVFARHNLGQQFFLQTEYENLSTELRFGDGNNREWVPGFFFGGGVFQPIGRGTAGVVVAGFYNFAYDDIKSPYNSPWVFRVGITL